MGDSDNSPTRKTTSPGTRSGSRLVARSRSRGQRASRVAASRAQVSARCSQLSSTISIVRVPSAWTSASIPARPPRSRTPRAAARACGSKSPSCSESRATHCARPVRPPRTRPASSSARRVLPTPPGPVRVSSREDLSSVRNRDSSRSRPTNASSAGGSPRPGNSAGEGAGRSARCRKARCRQAPEQYRAGRPPAALPPLAAREGVRSGAPHSSHPRELATPGILTNRRRPQRRCSGATAENHRHWTTVGSAQSRHQPDQSMRSTRNVSRRVPTARTAVLFSRGRLLSRARGSSSGTG